MNFTQSKLTKSEWQSIEKPLPEKEIQVLYLIKEGMADVEIAHNHQKSLIQYLKIAYSKEMEDHLFLTYFSPIYEQLKKADRTLDMKISSKQKIKTADKIRLEQNKTQVVQGSAYEFVLLEHILAIITGKLQGRTFEFHYYTLFQLSRNNVSQLNRHIVCLVQHTLDKYRSRVKLLRMLEQSVEIIEKNSLLLKYKNLTLYDHQKQIFTISCKPGPKLILYIAPTGTGKTLSPIGLSERHRVIFVCAARHVGLSLARSAISVQKKVAFAFGCQTMDDIRLHYYSAVDYTINKRSGGIGRVNNSNGTKVEIMICDIQSYLLSMTYMLQFNVPEEVIMYWDEPTISMDYEEHELHNLIQQTWSQNRVPNVVLSSATLPKFHTIPNVIQDFQDKFRPVTEDEVESSDKAPRIYNIVSHECAKTIPIFDNHGYIVVPHFFSREYREVLEVADHCSNNLTLLRYLDLGEVVTFIVEVLRLTSSREDSSGAGGGGGGGSSESSGFESGLESIGILDTSQLTMEKIKRGYLNLLQNIEPDLWEDIYTTLQSRRKCHMPPPPPSLGTPIKKYHSLPAAATSTTTTTTTTPPLDTLKGGGDLRRLKSIGGLSPAPPVTHRPGTYGIYLTTSDAHTLVEGPTIFLAHEVEKVAQFCLQQADIPEVVMDDLMHKIERNNVLSEKIMVLEKELEDAQEESQSSSSSSSSVSSATKHKSKAKGKSKGGSGGGGGGAGEEGGEPGEARSGGGGGGGGRRGDGDDGEARETRGVCRKLQTEIDNLRTQVRPVNLNDAFVPNTIMHLNKWAAHIDLSSGGTPYMSRIDDATIVEIMSLHEVDNSWKILLLMGIGIFTTHKNPKYLEIVKQLATEQQLYLIIASSDYIYGTNYQFCHGYLSKDMDLTQEKIIQSLGRIGRNNIQQSYSIRLRDNVVIKKLFTEQGITPEITNMNRLFVTMQEEQEEDEEPASAVRLGAA
jgi:uncharacterized membrane protein YgcG